MPTSTSLPSVLLGSQPDVALAMIEYLRDHGLKLFVLHDGEQLWQQLQVAAYDLLILDAALPTRTGFDLLRQWRLRSLQPIIMLTDQAAEADRIALLEMGADDCLDRHGNPRELLARIRVLWRRTTLSTRPATLRAGALQLDAGNLQVKLAGQQLSLTHAEFKVLEMLLRVPGQAQSRDELAARVLGRQSGPYNRSIDTHVSNLRRKLKLNIAERIQIRSIRGQGYALTLPDQEHLAGD